MQGSAGTTEVARRQARCGGAESRKKRQGSSVADLGSGLTPPSVWAIRSRDHTGVPLGGMWLAFSPVWLESLHARTPPCAVPRAPLVRMMGGFGYTGTTRPGKQSPRRVIPEEIPRPDYAVDGKPKARGPLFPWQIEVKSQKDIEGMRAAGRIAREVRGCEAPQP